MHSFLNTKPKGIPALKYIVSIFDPHGSARMTEFFIPSLKVFFNKEVAWPGEAPRNEGGPIEEVYLPKDLVDKVVKLAQLKVQAREAHKLLEANQDFLDVLGLKISQFGVTEKRRP